MRCGDGEGSHGTDKAMHRKLVPSFIAALVIGFAHFAHADMAGRARVVIDQRSDRSDVYSLEVNKSRHSPRPRPTRPHAPGRPPDRGNPFL